MSDLFTTLTERGITSAALARMLSVHRSQITRWRERGVPPRKARALYEITGIPLHVINPEIFPAPANENGSGK